MAAAAEVLRGAEEKAFGLLVRGHAEAMQRLYQEWVAAKARRDAQDRQRAEQLEAAARHAVVMRQAYGWRAVCLDALESSERCRYVDDEREDLRRVEREWVTTKALVDVLEQQRLLRAEVHLLHRCPATSSTHTHSPPPGGAQWAHNGRITGA